MSLLQPIKVTPNNSKRTFTIRKGTNKYRTMPMSKSEFEDAKYWTNNDWEYFLLSKDEYVKL